VPLANGCSEQLVRQLADARSGRVVFLSHCLLNENTRYLGGACVAGCLPEVVQPCLEQRLGMVQLPCPEQLAWGGVLEPMLPPIRDDWRAILAVLRLAPNCMW
jgi:hypothetical protein